MTPAQTTDTGIPLSDADLHDAVLKDVRLDWSSRTCEIAMSVFLDVRQNAVPCVLRFTAVRGFTITHVAPWGDSVFINGQTRSSDGHYLIEVQSGDVIDVDAEDAVLLRTSQILEPA